MSNNMWTLDRPTLGNSYHMFKFRFITFLKQLHKNEPDLAAASFYALRVLKHKTHPTTTRNAYKTPTIIAIATFDQTGELGRIIIDSELNFLLHW